MKSQELRLQLMTGTSANLEANDMWKSADGNILSWNDELISWDEMQITVQNLETSHICDRRSFFLFQNNVICKINWKFSYKILQGYL